MTRNPQFDADASTGGLSVNRNIDVDETEDEIKALAARVYWVHAINLDSTPLYLQFYNATAANVTVGTTTPLLTLAIPSQGDANGAGFTISLFPGVEFDTALTIAATTTPTGASGPGNNECLVNIGYK